MKNIFLTLLLFVGQFAHTSEVDEKLKEMYAAKAVFYEEIAADSSAEGKAAAFYRLQRKLDLIVDGPAYVAKKTYGARVNYGGNNINILPTTNYGGTNENLSPSTNYGGRNLNVAPSTNYGGNNTNLAPATNYGGYNRNYAPSTNFGGRNINHGPTTIYGGHNTNHGPTSTTIRR